MSIQPFTISYPLNDSPVSLAGWIVEKFRSWSDCNGDIEKCYTKDELLTNIMIYWVTETISSSARLYLEDGRTASQIQVEQYIEVPAGVGTFPKDLTFPPRELGSASCVYSAGPKCHKAVTFAALEQPALLIDDIRACFHELR